jgi:GT2 family glycosyltransferase
VVNNDVRLAPWTYELLEFVQRITQAWFVSGVSVQYQGQLDLYLEQGRAQAVGSLGVVTDARADGRTPEGFTKGGPDFSCFLITKECHRWFQFDEGFQPAYHEDNDYHRRLQLAGLGDRIFGVNLPFLHYGSATIKRSPEAQAAFAPKFAQCQQYYITKWGGLPGAETYTIPFGSRPGITEARALYLGQGRPDNDWSLDTTDLPPS